MTLAALAQLPPAMAAAIRPLYAQPSRARYIGYLQQMVHYTRFSGDELRFAAARARQSAAGDTMLSATLAALADEEEAHYRLAAADLSALGAAVSLEATEAVLAYRAYWNSIPANASWSFAGALYVLENVARYAGVEALSALAPLALTAQETRFVRAHLAADDAHGARLQRCCEHGLHAHGPAIVEGARRASTLWIDMHLAVLENEVVNEHPAQSPAHQLGGTRL